MSGRGRDVVIAVGMSIIAMGSAIGIYKGFLQEQGPVQLETAAARAPAEAAPAPPGAGSAPREGGPSAPARAGMTTMGPVAARELEEPTDLTPRLAAIEKLLRRHGLDETTQDGPRLDELAVEIERLRADLRRLELLVKQNESGGAGPGEQTGEAPDQEVRAAQRGQVAALEPAGDAPAAKVERKPPGDTPNEGGQSRVYSVQQGDTLTRIARRLCLPVAELQSMNPELGDIDELRVGQALRYRETQSCGDDERADRTNAAT